MASDSAVRHYFQDMFTPKPIADVHGDASDSGLKKKLNFIDLTCLGIGSIIGSGIFVLTGQAAGENAGPAVVISFLIGGICSGLAALCYSEMSSMIPVSGSAYTYAYAATGEFLGWMVGWNLILEYLVGAATVTVGWSSYVVSLIQDVASVTGYNYTCDPKWTQAPLNGSFQYTGNYVNIPAISIAVALTFLVIFGVRESALVNAIIVVVKVVVVLIFIFAGSAWVNRDNWEPFIPPQESFGHYGWTGILQATTMVFFSYIGFDAVSTTAQECIRPQRDLPIGIISSLIICTLLYIGVSLVLTGMTKYTTLIGQAAPISFAAEQVGQTWLAIVTEVGAILGTTSVVLVSLMSQPRIFYTMARDGLFPQWVAKTHPRYGTPWVTSLITGAVTAILGGILPIDILSELTSVGTLVAFVLVSISVTVMRFTHKDLPRSFRVPLGPFIIPILSALCSAALIGWSTSTTLIRLVVWIAIGIALYLAYGKQHSLLQKRLKAHRKGIHHGNLVVIETSCTTGSSSSSDDSYGAMPINARIDVDYDIKKMPDIERYEYDENGKINMKF